MKIIALAALAGLGIWASGNGDAFMEAAGEAMTEIQTAIEQGDARANAWLQEYEVPDYACTAAARPTDDYGWSTAQPDVGSGYYTTSGNSGMTLSRLKAQVEAARLNWMAYQNNPAMARSMESFRAFTEYQNRDQQYRAALQGR